MDILEIIKQRKSIRKYLDKKIPRDIIEQIIEAGVWGPSVPSFLNIQPWRLVIVESPIVKQQLVTALEEKSKVAETGVNIMLSSAARIMKSASVWVAVYNSNDLEKIKNRYREIYSKFSWIIKTAQLCAISATIQNMILVAEDLGIGTCWLDNPLFCKADVNKILNAASDDELIAILTLGYPAEEGKRSRRKPKEEMIRYIT